MLSEEALILSAVFGACMLLALGVLELVWPSRPRHLVRRPQPLSLPPQPAASPAPPPLTLSVAPARPPAEIVFRRPPGYVDPSPVTEPVSPPTPIVPVAPAPPTDASPAEPPEHVDPVASPERRDLEPSTPVAMPRPAESPAPPPPFEPSPVLPPAEIFPSAEPPAPAPPRRRSKISPHARPHRVLRAPNAPVEQRSGSAATDMAPERGERPAPMKPGQPWSDASTLPAPDAKTIRDSPAVEACFALYQEKRFDEVVSVGTEMLAKLGVQWPASGSHESAALWSVVGLAKQALGDDDGARVALESAIDAAPELERPTYGRHLAALSLDAALARLARAGGQDTGDRVATIRTAIAWADRGLAVAASDAALGSAREAAFEALWPAYEQASTALLQRQEFAAARQLLQEALDDPALPRGRAAGFRGLFSSTFGAEVGQLTAQAILSMQEAREGEALESLKRAEEVLAAIPPEALPPTRRDEVDQRLWWGYAELGSRRLEAGDYEEALDPLIHALRFDSIGPERQAETRAAIVRTLEGIAALRAMSIRRLADAACRTEAAQGAEQLRALLRTCVGLGITESELWAAYTRIQRLCEELSLDEPA